MVDEPENETLRSTLWIWNNKFDVLFSCWSFSWMKHLEYVQPAVLPQLYACLCLFAPCLCFSFLVSHTHGVIHVWTYAWICAILSLMYCLLLEKSRGGLSLCYQWNVSNQHTSQHGMWVYICTQLSSWVMLCVKGLREHFLSKRACLSHWFHTLVSDAHLRHWSQTLVSHIGFRHYQTLVSDIIFRHWS